MHVEKIDAFDCSHLLDLVGHTRRALTARPSPTLANAALTTMDTIANRVCIHAAVCNEERRGERLSSVEHLQLIRASIESLRMA
jgi:hypothetical protein